MKRIVALCLLLVCLAPLAAWCEEPKPGASHQEAVAELFKLMDIENSARSGAQTMIGVMLDQNAAMEPYRDVLLKWADKTLSWDKMESRLTDLYMQTFTEAEIRDMIVFYKTPTGKKTLEKLPMLMQEGAKIGAELAQEHQGELVEMIQARAKELGEDAGGGDDSGSEETPPPPPFQ